MSARGAPAVALAPRLSQAERSARSDRRIVRAAIRLIARQGYSKTTLAQIGREAGCSGGLVSHRFGSKEGLLRALVDHIRIRFLEDQLEPSMAGRSGLDALCAMLDTYLAELTRREERMRALYVLMGESWGPVPAVRAAFAELDEKFRASVAERIEEGRRLGEIRRDVKPPVEAAAFVAMLRGTAMQWLTAHGSFDLDGARESLKAALRGRLAP